MRPTITLAIICKNEEENIVRLLKSVDNIFDEICITDTGSTDLTIQMIKNIKYLKQRFYDIKLSHYEWDDDFSAARNFNFSQATSDFIYWMDADDIITDKEKSNMQNLKLDSDIIISNYIYSPNVQVPRERIIRRSLNLQWQGQIHESIPIYNHLKILKLTETNNIGPTHLKSEEDIQKDKGRNERILLKSLQKERNPRNLFYYASELWDQAKWTESIQIFKEYLNSPDINQLTAYYKLAVSYYLTQDEKLAVDTCLQGIKHSHGQFAEFFSLIGEIYFNKGAWQESIHWYEKVCEMDIPVSDLPVITHYYGKKSFTPWEKLSECYFYLGQIKKAYDCLKKAKSLGLECQLKLKSYQDDLFPGRKANSPIRLSLGSGGKFTCSYKSTDIYEDPNIAENFSMLLIPYETSTVESIHSEHSLEHVSKLEAEAAIAEWARVLKPYGTLDLEIPDLEACCANYVNDVNNRWWHEMTIHGRQNYGNPPNPMGEFHKTGFDDKLITKLLVRNNFRIDSLVKSNKYGTPSLEIKATQIKKLRICFVSHVNMDSPTYRIVVNNLDKVANLEGSPIESFISEKPDLKSADWFILFTPNLELIRNIKDKGGLVAFHLSEDWLTPEIINNCNNSHLVLCCSIALWDKVHQLTTSRTILLQDPHE